MKVLIATIATISIVLVFVLLTKWYNNQGTCVTPYIQSQLKSHLQSGFQKAVMSEQDKNPIIALMHAQEALNCIENVQKIVSVSWIEKHMQTNISALKQALILKTSQVMSHIAKAYPKLSVKSKYAEGAGWIFS